MTDKVDLTKPFMQRKMDQFEKMRGEFEALNLETIECESSHRDGFAL